LDVHFVKAFDLPESWFKCLKLCLEKGYEYTIEKGSRVGCKRKELDFVVVQVKNPKFRPIIPEVPKEVPPPTSHQFVNEYMTYLVTGFKKEEDYTYGERLAEFPYFKGFMLEAKRKINQIQEVIRMYKEEGFETNQACMEVAMPSDIKLENPPCMRLVDTRIRYGKLHFFVYFRSWDLWGGYPTNMAALQLLKEWMAEEIGVEDGELIALSKGLHLYDTEWELAKIVVQPKTRRKIEK